jgi:predicted ATPase
VNAIRTPDQRVRVFVSSTLGELAEERTAVRAAVEQLRLTPIMFELGARPHPPQALYRSYLAQSDVFVGIYWQRYGWVAPDMGVSGLEDEYRLSAGMPRLVYVKRPAPDIEPRLQALLDDVQQEDTTSYRPFRDADELRDLVLDDLAVMLTERFAGSEEPPAVEHPPTNLPSPTSTFVGREALRDDLRGRLGAEGARLVTVTGPGGAGKTRLALEAAASCRAGFPDGVFFVDLSAEREPDEVFAAIVRTIALPGGGDDPPLDALARGLRNARMLLVLDNFEQATDAARGVVELLEQCPTLTVLVTSRAALRVRGETLVHVPPLSLPEGRSGRVAEVARSEAVQLFVDRAASVVPGFALTDENAATVAAICSRLDGLPLAIELAAPRVRLFGVDELSARLDEHPAELGGGARDLPERQQTLRRAIAWSTELLDEAERAVFGLLAVFTGARLADVEAVATQVPSLAGLDVVACLGSLVDKNLVRSTFVDDGGPRLSMLHTIQEFAGEWLRSQPDVAAVERAHAEHYTRLARDWQGRLGPASRREVLAAVATELGNLRTAWAHWIREGAVAPLDDLLDLLWSYYDAKGNYREAVELGTGLLGVLARQPETPERVRDEIAVETSLTRSMIAVHGYTAEVERRIRATLDRSDAVAEGPLRFPVLRSLATLRILSSDLWSVAPLGVELLDIAEQQGEPALLADAHLVVGVSSAYADLPACLSHLDTSIAQFAAQPSSPVRFRVGPSPGVVAPLVSGLLLWRTGHPDRARARIARGLEISQALGHPYSRAYALFHGALAALWQQDIQQVTRHADEVLEVAEAHDYPIWHALGLVLRGTARVVDGAADAGIEEIDRGFLLYAGLVTPPAFWPELLTVRAGACLAAGRVDAARGFLADAAAVVQDGDPQEPEIDLLRGEVHLAAPAPDVAGAEAAFERAATLAEERGARMSQLVAATRLAELRRGTSRGVAARAALQEVYDTFTEGHDTPQLLAARARLDAG